MKSKGVWLNQKDKWLDITYLIIPVGLVVGLFTLIWRRNK